MFGKKNNKKYFLTYFILDDAFFVKEVIYNTLLQKPPRSDCMVFFEFEGDATLKSEFLNLLPSIRSDVLFLDVELSDGLVWDLIPQIKEKLPNSYIVVMTDGLSPETQQRRHQFEEEVFTILEKPFQPGYLYSIIDKVINDLADIDDTPDFLKEKTSTTINGTKSKMLSQLEDTTTVQENEVSNEQSLAENETSLFAEEGLSFDLEEEDSPFVTQPVNDEFEVEFDSTPSSIEPENASESTIEWNPSTPHPVFELEEDEEEVDLIEETPFKPAVISQENLASDSLIEEVPNTSHLLGISFEENLSEEPSEFIHFDDNLSAETHSLFEDNFNHEIEKEEVVSTPSTQIDPVSLFETSLEETNSPLSEEVSFDVEIQTQNPSSTSKVEWSLDEVQPSNPNDIEFETSSSTEAISFDVEIQTPNPSSTSKVEWSLDEVQPSTPDDIEFETSSSTESISFDVEIQTPNPSSTNEVEWSLDDVQPSNPNDIEFETSSSTEAISFDVEIQTPNPSSTNEVEWSLDDVQPSNPNSMFTPSTNANFEYKNETDLYNETISLNDDLMNSDNNDDFVITPPKQMYPSTVDRKTQRLNQVRNQNQWDQRKK